MRHVTVHELHNQLQQGDSPVLLDVREEWELARCQLPGCTWIPMGQILARVNELNKQSQTVVICHHGIRSWQVAKYLEREGFSDVINLTGGIDAWAKEIDPAMTIY
jgi:rhodanese-related sulfurtransferase